MQTDRPKIPLAAVAGQIWCVVVIGTYLWANTGYYSEKLSAFGRYAVQIVWGNHWN